MLLKSKTIAGFGIVNWNKSEQVTVIYGLSLSVSRSLSPSLASLLFWPLSMVLFILGSIAFYLACNQTKVFLLTRRMCSVLVYMAMGLWLCEVNRTQIGFEHYEHDTCSFYAFMCEWIHFNRKHMENSICSTHKVKVV